MYIYIEREIDRYTYIYAHREAGGLERGRVVSSLPGAVLGEVALVPRGAHGVGSDIDRNTEVVSREANRLPDNNTHCMI